MCRVKARSERKEMLEELISERKRELKPPYAAPKTFLKALETIRGLNPQRVNWAFLREHSVGGGVGNEYKIIQALRFLDFIDGESRPTPKLIFLYKRKGYMGNLRYIVEEAYQPIFSRLGDDLSSTRVYNYFVTKLEMGVEVAQKATRFFVSICRISGIEVKIEALSAEAQKEKIMVVKSVSTKPQVMVTPLMFPLTPETAAKSTEELTEIFRKSRIAWEKSLEGDKE